MVDRELRELTNGGLAGTEALDGADPIYNLEIDPSNIATVTSMADADFILAYVSGVLKKINMTNVMSHLVLPRKERFFGTFSGLVSAVTGASNVNSRQLRFVGETGKTNRITGLTIIGCGGLFGTSGSTQIAVSDTDYTDNTNEGLASIAYNAAQSARTVVNITLPGDPPYIYVYVKAAGNQGDIQFQIDVEVTT